MNTTIWVVRILGLLMLIVMFVMLFSLQSRYRSISNNPRPAATAT